MAEVQRIWRSFPRLPLDQSFSIPSFNPALLPPQVGVRHPFIAESHKIAAVGGYGWDTQREVAPAADSLRRVSSFEGIGRATSEEGESQWRPDDFEDRTESKQFRSADEYDLSKPEDLTTTTDDEGREHTKPRHPYREAFAQIQNQTIDADLKMEEVHGCGEQRDGQTTRLVDSRNGIHREDQTREQNEPIEDLRRERGDGTPRVK